MPEYPPRGLFHLVRYYPPVDLLCYGEENFNESIPHVSATASTLGYRRPDARGDLHRPRDLRDQSGERTTGVAVFRLREHYARFNCGINLVHDDHRRSAADQSAVDDELPRRCHRRDGGRRSEP